MGLQKQEIALIDFIIDHLLEEVSEGQEGYKANYETCVELCIRINAFTAEMIEQKYSINHDGINTHKKPDKAEKENEIKKHGISENTLINILQYRDRYEFAKTETPKSLPENYKPSTQKLINIASYLTGKLVQMSHEVYEITLKTNGECAEVNELLQFYSSGHKPNLVRKFEGCFPEIQLIVAKDIILFKKDLSTGMQFFNRTSDPEVKKEIVLMLLKIADQPLSSLLNNVIQWIEYQQEDYKFKFMGLLVAKLPNAESEQLIQKLFKELNPNFQSEIIRLLVNKTGDHADLIQTLCGFIASFSLRPVALSLFEKYETTKDKSNINIAVLELFNTKHIGDSELRMLAIDVLNSQTPPEAYLNQLIQLLDERDAKVELANIARFLISGGYLNPEKYDRYKDIFDRLLSETHNDVSLRRVLTDLIQANLIKSLPHTIDDLFSRLEGNVEKRNVVLQLLKSGHYDWERFQQWVTQISNDMEKIRIIKYMFKDEAKFTGEIIYLIDSLWQGVALVAAARLYIQTSSWSGSFFQKHVFGRLITLGLFYDAYLVLITIVQEELKRKESVLLSETDMKIGDEDRSIHEAFLQLIRQIDYFSPELIQTLIKYLAMFDRCNFLHQRLSKLKN